MRTPTQLLLTLSLLAAPGALAQTTLYQLDSSDDFEGFTRAVIPLGDQDGDGRADYGVLVPFRGITQGPNEGRTGVVEVRKGRNGALIRTLENPMPQTARVYWDAIAIDDSDGDGNPDLLVTWVSGLFAEVGVIRVSSATGAIIDELTLPAGRVLSPYGMRPIDDVDGDGVTDFSVALGVVFPGTAVGNGVALYSGSELVPLSILEPANRHFSYGWDVMSVGDLDGDGVSDVAVSSNGDNTNGNRSGALYFHSAATGALIDVLYGQVPEERFGYAMERLPDLDGDGVEDLAVSSTFYSSPADHPFVTFLSGASRATIRTITSSRVDDTFGGDLTLVGDMDGNGEIEIAIGAPAERADPAAAGRVEFYSIHSGAMLTDSVAERTGQAYGGLILHLPDVVPNGFGEVLIAGDGLVGTGAEPGTIRVLDGPAGTDCVPSIPYCAQTVPNSVGALATLTQVGNADLSGSQFRLFANEVAVGSTVLLLGSLDTGFVANPGGSAGNLCLGGSIGRFSSIVQQAGPSGRVVFRPDLHQMPTPTGFVAANQFQIWNFQAWYRDMTPSGAAGSHFTSALSVDVCP